MNPAAACQEFIQRSDAREIAKQLRQDSDFCKVGKRPSFLALFLPRASNELADEISKHLLNQDDVSQARELPASVRQLWYNGLIDGIRTFLGTTSVAAYFELGSDGGKITGVSNHNAQYSYAPRRPQVRLCYVCRFVNNEAHPLYPDLCESCGSFNLANSLISLPGSLNLQGKTALVTGGRVNLGFSTALRLLRCGAKVIVSSRYPRDAELRYSAESDSMVWCERLRIIGADFRAAKDAFDLVNAVKRQLRLWSGTGHLDILINNAAQTLTDPVHTEKQAIAHERILQAQANASPLLLDNRYEPRLRGGTNSSWESSLRWHDNPASEKCFVGYETEANQYTEPVGVDTAISSAQRHVQHPATMVKSSWVQSIDEIPYEDLMSAHSVNFFVPLILCRELLPMMGGPKHEREQADHDADQVSGRTAQQADENHGRKDPERPHGYVINVSSREGIFEHTAGSEAKNGRHVHTNTSKAALNMITATEAYTCWRLRRVAMNTVDPGYMSAAPEMQKYGDCPITFEDGAARVLWPIAIAEREGKVIRGKFLKHFGTVEVDIGAGVEQ